MLHSTYTTFKAAVASAVGAATPAGHTSRTHVVPSLDDMTAEELKRHVAEELIPNFRTIKLKDKMLSEIIIQLMPHCNQAEGRVLEREMGKENTFDDPDAVLAACTAIVSGNTDSTIEDARREAGSMPEGTPRLAAIAAAAAMVPGGASPGTSTHPPRHNLQFSSFYIEREKVHALQARHSDHITQRAAWDFKVASKTMMVLAPNFHVLR